MTREGTLNDTALIDEVAREIAKARNLVAFTGAGVSAESGIPTFRDPGGLWDRFSPEELGTPAGLLGLLETAPERIIEFVHETLDTFGRVEPNAGHRALAELERMGILRSIVTQNIDNLHQQAGNAKVWEVHGNVYRLRCTSCGATEKWERDALIEHFRRMFPKGRKLVLQAIMGEMPDCRACMGMLRPDVVLFGEQVQNLTTAFAEAGNCDLMLTLGTSGAVYPAAMLPEEARRDGSKVIEINPGPSGFGEISDYLIHGTTAQVLPVIVERIRELGIAPN